MILIQIPFELSLSVIKSLFIVLFKPIEIIRQKDNNFVNLDEIIRTKK